MAVLRQTLHHVQERLNKHAKHFIIHNPYLAYSALLMGMPNIILISLMVWTMTIMFPIAWLMGWL